MIKIIKEHKIKIHQKNYLVNVFTEIISNFISSLLLIEDTQINELTHSKRKYDKKLLITPNLINYIKNKAFLKLVKKFEKKEIQNFIQSFLIKKKFFFMKKKIYKSQIYIYCNTPLAHSCRKILNYFKFNFKRIIEDKDLDKNKKYFKNIVSKNTCILICNSKIDTQKRVETKLKKFGFKNILIYEG